MNSCFSHPQKNISSIYPTVIERCSISPLLGQCTTNQFITSCIWIVLIYASAAALSLHLVDKGSWHAPRPSWISNDVRWILFPSKRDPESSKTPSMITARQTATPQKVTRDEKRLRYYLKLVKKHNVFQYGAEQFSEPELETARDHSSFKVWHTRFT